MSVKIVEVKGRRELRKFVDFPNHLYKDNPYYVPAMQSDELDTLDSNVNPVFDFAESIYFLAYKDDKIVGRIAGIINHKANETWNQQAARFGYVDFIDDDEVVDALFDAVISWAKSKDMDMLEGPLGFTDMDRQGMLIKGFDQIATIITIYNYAYYPKQLERIGFIKHIDWNEFLIKIPEEVSERHNRLAEQIKEKYGLRVLKFKKKKDLLPYAREIFYVLNKGYSHLYGFSELSERQIDYYVDMYISKLILDYMTVVQRVKDNKIIGVAITMPNLSRPMQKAKGKLFPFGWYHLLKAIKGKGDKVVDLYLIAVLPEYINKGIISLIFQDLIPIYNRDGIKFAEGTPQLETNRAIQMQWNYFDNVQNKTRRAYIKSI